MNFDKKGAQQSMKYKSKHFRGARALSNTQNNGAKREPLKLNDSRIYLNLSLI